MGGARAGRTAAQTDLPSGPTFRGDPFQGYFVGHFECTLSSPSIQRLQRRRWQRRQHALHGNGSTSAASTSGASQLNLQLGTVDAADAEEFERLVGPSDIRLSPVYASHHSLQT